MRLILFEGLRPFSRSTAVRDALAGVTLASMNIPQVLGYARIAGTPVATGLYTVLLPLVAFAFFGSSRHQVVAANSATAAIFSSPLSRMATPASEQRQMPQERSRPPQLRSRGGHDRNACELGECAQGRLCPS